MYGRVPAPASGAHSRLRFGQNLADPMAFADPSGDRGPVVTMGRSPNRASGTTSDLVRLCLAFIDDLPHQQVDPVGLSSGAWLAAEVAVASCHRLRKLVLADPVGIKLGGPTERDILDIFNLNPAAVRRAAW